MSKSASLRFPEESFSDGASFDFYKPHSHPGLSCLDASMTRQEFADDCDINTIMERYQVTGQLPQVAGEPQYGDYLGVPNLMEALDAMTQAQTAFMALPASVRKTFDNDPVEFVAFASDPSNLDQMRVWGLAPPAPPAPAPVPVPEPSLPAADAVRPAAAG